MLSPDFLFATFALLGSVAAAPASAPTATIANGQVIGTTTSVPNAPVGVNKFLGIPFAQSPPLRFAPPTDPVPWTTPLQATTLSPACVQQFNYPAGLRNETMRLFNNPAGAPPVESEDCLYLNVYTPANATSTSGLAVMVWLYGGNLIFGTASIPFYDGSSFAANQNVVIVTLNYRTNAFGFSASPELPDGQQNAGFLDQRKALAWVQANIAAFGGDPAKVTLFGESAGGFSIKQLVALPPNPLPFRAGILESTGGSFSSQPENSWNELVSRAGCNTSASQIDCMRQVPATTIKSIIEQNSISFGPVEDGVTYVANTRSKFIAKTAAKVPLLHGTNANEGRVFAYLAGIKDGGTQLTAFLNTTFPNRPDIQNAILAFYPAALASIPYELISQIVTDYIYTCTTSALTTLTALNGYPTWRYYYQGVFPNLALFPNPGAYHTSEIPQVFGTYPSEGATAQQIGLSQYMQTTWANFAKAPQNGPGWPKIGSNWGVEIGNLGKSGSTGEVTTANAAIDAVCLVYGPIIAAQPL